MFELFEPETYYEYVGDGYSVCIQHCEFENSDGMFCNKYLGVNYPSTLCAEHHHSRNRQRT